MLGLVLGRELLLPLVVFRAGGLRGCEVLAAADGRGWGEEASRRRDRLAGDGDADLASRRLLLLVFRAAAMSLRDGGGTFMGAGKSSPSGASASMLAMCSYSFLLIRARDVFLLIHLRLAKNMPTPAKASTTTAPVTRTPLCTFMPKIFTCELLFPSALAEPISCSAAACSTVKSAPSGRFTDT